MEMPQVEVPEEIVERVHRLCLALPEVTERVDFSRVRSRSTAWSFDIRRRSFCLLVASEDITGEPDTILVLRADPDERDALLAIGHPYYPSAAGSDRVTLVITDDADWDEIAELITESYRQLAPKKLIALLEMPRPDDRVTLRLWSKADAPFLAEASADPDIRRYNGDHDSQGLPAEPPTTAEAEAIIEQFALNWDSFSRTKKPSGVAFAITDTSSGELVGCCGVDDWTGEDVAQFGYWIAAPARGRGYARRAAILLTRWLFELGAARVFLTVVDGNEGSVAVARRAGLVYEGTMRSHSVWQGRRYDVLWFAALAQEWPMR